MRRRALATAALLIAVLAPAAAADAKRVRLFAVGPKFALDWVDTREHFHDKLLALADSSERAGAPMIQAGAADVASSLLGPADPQRPVQTARDLVTLPEDVGLMAAFSGARGTTARTAPDLTTSILGLIATYAPVSAYYQGRFPSLGSRPFPPTRLLAIALTDTFVRNAVETFAELAQHLKAYVVAGVTLAQDWHVVCADKAAYRPPPGGAPCDEEDPAKVALLRAPDEPTRDYAYEATTPKPSTMALVFDPSGKLIAKTVKAYLTPTELPGQLDLVPGEVSGVEAIDTPVGRLGIVTSKDAWMPDVTTKLDQEGVEVLIQPEFFVNDTVRTTGMWAPDNLQGSGVSDVLRHPSINALVLPELVGNVFDFSADAQQAIFVKPRSTRSAPIGGFVGQPTAPGFATVSPWVVKDPDTPDEPIAQRRKRLGQAGEALLPSGPPCADASRPGPCRGGQVEGVLFADVEVGQPRRLHRQPARSSGVAPFSANRALDPSRRAQRNVSLAARGRTVVAAFEEAGRVLVARSADAGAHWADPVAMARASTGAQWWPSVAIGPRGEVWLAWQEGGAVRYARSRDGGRTFGAPVAVAPTKARQWKPSIAATGRGRAVVAWIDERARFAGDDLPQAGAYVARLDANDPSDPVRLDGIGADLAVDPLAATLDNAWSPSVAADPVRHDHVLVTWLDFRTYDWDVAARESTDGGATFGPERAVNATPAGREALEDSPRAAYAGTTPLVAFTDWTKDPDSATRPTRLYDTAVAVPGAGAQAQVDDHGADHVSTFSPALAGLAGGDAIVAWQDMAAGPADIRLARVRAGSPPRAARALRVDDGGRAGWNQWRPAVAVAGDRAVVAWEDERDGLGQVYFARAPVRLIR